MRLGKYPCNLKESSLAREAYGVEYIPQLEERGFHVTGLSPDGKFVEIVELENHPWFLGCQFHPEYKSRPGAAPPLFRSFVAAARAHRNAGKTTVQMTAQVPETV